MKTFNSGKTDCDWAGSRIDMRLDKILTGVELTRFEEHLKSCSSCSSELSLAKRIRETLHKNRSVECPDRVVDTVMMEVNRDIRASRKHARDRYWRSLIYPVWRPVMITAMLAFVTFTVVQFSQPDYSQQEVEQALNEAKWALAFLGDVNERTNKVVRDDVLRGTVAEPLEGILQRTLSAFDSGKSPEDE